MSGASKTEGVAVQRCVEPTCGATFALNERLYVCSLCGGLLDIEKPYELIGEATALREIWIKRLASPHISDHCGVRRFRELLPFPDNAPLVSLAEGNTPLYPRNRISTRILSVRG